MSRIRALLGATSVFLALFATVAAAERAPSLEGVMQGLAESGGVRARYVERKHLALLAQPLETEGVLYFDPPGRLARHVEKPGPSRLAVRDDQVVLRDASGEERIDLAGNEVARTLAESLAVALGGDLERLGSRYEVAFESDAEGWRMELVPRSSSLRRLVRRLVVSGAGRELRRMELEEDSGDRTVTEFVQVETGVRFTPDEARAIFLLDPASAKPGDPARSTPGDPARATPRDEER